MELLKSLNTHANIGLSAYNACWLLSYRRWYFDIKEDIYWHIRVENIILYDIGRYIFKYILPEEK